MIPVKYLGQLGLQQMPPAIWFQSSVVVTRMGAGRWLWHGGKVLAWYVRIPGYVASTPNQPQPPKPSSVTVAAVNPTTNKDQSPGSGNYQDTAPQSRYKTSFRAAGPTV